MESLADKFKMKVRSLPLILKFKIALCLRYLLLAINNQVFNKRMESLLSAMDLKRDFNLGHAKGPKLRKRMDATGFTSRIRDYALYKLTVQHSQTAFNNLLYKYEPTSLFKKLFDPGFDFLLRILIDRLSRMTHSLFTKKVMDIPNKLEEVFKPLELSFRRQGSSQSITMIPSEREHHDRVRTHLF
mmetsp:Transcript_33448/g.51359  ORF Transcript_33448/g.51359 Transcript_33448/m.51359 type:complete len:186 (+) Transcript_33448:5130-5687(+)